ncbi:MAG TPA: peptidylprolyl isomerase [Caulobacteraceae bacterium]
MSRTLAIAAALLLSACATQETIEGGQWNTPVAGDADFRTPDPQNILVIDTNRGRIFVELVPEVAPEHVKRVRELARAGVYDGRTFFRVIDRFMAQTGDPLNTGEGGTDKPNLKAEFTFRRDPAGAFVTAASPSGLEEGFVASLPVISQAASYAEMTSDQKVAAWGHYCPGVVGMARDEEPDTANSQFFIMRQPYPSLDKRYTAFGRAISGVDVVRSIKTGEPVEAPQDVMERVTVLADWPEATRPKVQVMDPHSAFFQSMIRTARDQKGADFSLCDIDIPVRIG